MDLVVICGGENGTNEHHLAFKPLPATLWLPTTPPLSTPIGVLMVAIGYTSKKLSKMAGNSASYLFKFGT